mmetsp:Transcript_9399/g.31447  ORF Transcript_9399/g.31447 Transcript_9399/m.31447 type:complete len:1072 (-) Transcript_9399:53-3268(-)
MQCSRCLAAFLLVMHAVGGEEKRDLGVLRQLGHHEDSWSFPAIVTSTCLPPAVSPGFLSGRIYHSFLGPRFDLCPREFAVPFHHDTVVMRSYLLVRPVDQENCRSIVALVAERLARHPSHKRYAKMRSCVRSVAKRMLEDWEYEIAVNMFASELSLRSRVNTALLCDALQQQITLFDAWTEDRLQEVETREIDLPDLTSAIRLATTQCNITLWWLCNDTRPESEALELLTRWNSLQLLASKTVDQALRILVHVCNKLVDDAYMRWLGRPADTAGLKAYSSLILNEGKTAQHMRAILQESDEYKGRCKRFDCTSAGTMVEKAFLDELLREPEQQAVESYSNLLISTGNLSLVVEILRNSSEYAELHRIKGRAEQTLKEVEAVFAEVLGRKPDRRGASSYTREILLGHLTPQELRNALQESDEFNNIASFLSRSLTLTEAVKWSLPTCLSDLPLASLLSKEPQIEVYTYSLSFLRSRRDYGAGRWCRRQDCNSPHTKSCGHWPVELYNIIELMVLGDDEDEQLKSFRSSALAGQEREHEERWPTLAFEDRLRDRRSIASMYSELYGRFPLPRELSAAISAISQNGSSLDVLEKKMRNESNHMKALQNTTDTYTKWLDAVQTMVSLFDLFDLSLPEEIHSCFRKGMVYSSAQSKLGFACLASESIEKTLEQGAAESSPPCLCRSMSERVCQRGMLLCRPLESMVIPSELHHCNQDTHLSYLTYGNVFWPRSSNDLFHEFECHNTGKLLAQLQNRWNSHSPLFHNATCISPRGSWQQHDGETTFPLAMYVNDRPLYFAEVIRSLQAARSVSTIKLLVVSLDSVRQDMIELVLNIDFLTVRLLFHPVREDLLSMSPVLAIKSHWWWLQHMIWNEVEELRSYDGNIALLEEDHVVTPDYVELMRLLIAMQQNACPQCWGVCVRHGCASERERDLYKICRTRAVINTGISFNRSIYNLITQSDFLHFLDGWDWSIFHLAQTGQIPDMMLAPAISRVRNIGRKGSTVNDIVHEDLLRQLNYTDVGSKADFHESSFRIDDAGHCRLLDVCLRPARLSAPLPHTPPAWEPLYIGGIGFVSR